jgi:hypothetical protein
MNGCVVLQVVERESMLFGGLCHADAHDRQEHVLTMATEAAKELIGLGNC